MMQKNPFFIHLILSMRFAAFYVQKKIVSSMQNEKKLTSDWINSWLMFSISFLNLVFLFCKILNQKYRDNVRYSIEN